MPVNVNLIITEATRRTSIFIKFNTKFTAGASDR